MSILSPAWQSPRDFATAVSFGLVGGYSYVSIRGYRATLNVGDDIWSEGGAYPWPAAPVVMEVVSTSANDTALGTGARSVTITALDGTGAPLAPVTVVLNGLTPVLIPTALYRINRLVVASAGSGLLNAGDIIVRAAGGGTVYKRAVTGFGMARDAVFTVPAGYDVVATGFHLGAAEPTNTYDFQAGVWARDIATNAARIVFDASASLSALLFEHARYPLPALTDVSLRAVYVSNINQPAYGGFSGILRQRLANIG